MYILQKRNVVLIGGKQWFDIMESANVSEVTKKYESTVHEGIAPKNLRIVKAVEVEVNTTVEVVK